MEALASNEKQLPRLVILTQTHYCLTGFLETKDFANSC